MAEWQIWLIAAIFLAALEVVTTTFVFLWFAIGALLAAGLAFCGLDILVQGSIFVLTSLILVLYTRPLINKFIKEKKHDIKTNLEKLEGRVGLVTETIDGHLGTGLVNLQGEIWSAVAADGQLIEEGQKVKIVQVVGVKLAVKKIEEENK